MTGTAIVVTLIAVAVILIFLTLAGQVTNQQIVDLLT